LRVNSSFCGYLLDAPAHRAPAQATSTDGLDRNLTLQQQAAWTCCTPLPIKIISGIAWTMEYRRAMTIAKDALILLVKAKPANPSAKNNEENSAAWSDAAKAMSRKLRPTDSIYRLAADLFPWFYRETDTLNPSALRRLQESCKKSRQSTAKPSTSRSTTIRSRLRKVFQVVRDLCMPLR